MWRFSSSAAGSESSQERPRWGAFDEDWETQKQVYHCLILHHHHQLPPVVSSPWADLCAGSADARLLSPLPLSSSRLLMITVAEKLLKVTVWWIQSWSLGLTRNRDEESVSQIRIYCFPPVLCFITSARFFSALLDYIALKAAGLFSFSIWAFSPLRLNLPL